MDADEENKISKAAALLGRVGGAKGGKSTSLAKQRAARKNGKKGGRPAGGKYKRKDR